MGSRTVMWPAVFGRLGSYCGGPSEGDERTDALVELVFCKDAEGGGEALFEVLPLFELVGEFRGPGEGNGVVFGAADGHHGGTEVAGGFKVVGGGGEYDGGCRHFVVRLLGEGRETWWGQHTLWALYI